jgi:hypothetical protein
MSIIVNDAIFINDISKNIGIGTTIPKTTLDVLGTVLMNGGNVGIGTTTPKTTLDVLGTVLMNGGNVGIGTTLPKTTLDVNGNVQITGPITINADGVAMTINHDTAQGYSVIFFNSRQSFGSDKAFILVQDESAFTPGTGSEDLRMTIGVHNDFRTSTTHSDELWFQGGGRLVYNVGSWDSELNTIIGTPGVGSAHGGIAHEWRVNNAPVVVINASGNVGIGTTNPKSRLDIVGNVIVDGTIGGGTYIFDAYTTATDYSSIQGEHTTSSTTTSWNTSIHFSANDTRTGHIYNTTSNNTVATGDFVEYAVPSSMRQAWLAHLPWSTCRFFDVLGKMANGTMLWQFRVNAFQSQTANSGADHSGVTVVPIAAVDRFTHIRIQGGRGRYHLMGIAWSKQDRQHHYGGHTGFINNDNICGLGAVLQMVERRTEIRAHYACATSGDGTLTDIYVDIVPIRSNSKIVLQFMVNGEAHQDVVYLVSRSIGGAAATLIGFNTNRGNVRHSGVAASTYDQDQNSTPENMYISWSDFPNTLSSVRYYVSVRSSSSAAYTFALNGTLNGTNFSTGAESYEIMVSNAIASELWV